MCNVVADVAHHYMDNGIYIIKVLILIGLLWNIKLCKLSNVQKTVSLNKNMKRNKLLLTRKD